MVRGNSEAVCAINYLLFDLPFGGQTTKITLGDQFAGLSRMQANSGAIHTYGHGYR